MPSRYDDREFERDDESYGERAYKRRDDERPAGHDYGSERSRYGRATGSGASPRYGAGRDYNEYTSGYTNPYAGDFERGYGARDYGPRYGREGGYGGGYDTTDRGYDYGERARDYGRDYGPRYGRRRERDDDDRDRIRSFDTDYGRTTSRFYGRSGYDYGRDDYDERFGGRDDEYGPRGRGRDERGWWNRAADEVMSWFGDEEAARRRRIEARGEAGNRGRGPKNYRRSDERIRDDINDRLTDNDWLDASDVDVAVLVGEVTLSGTVDSRYAKRIAEDIAQSVTGVSDVQNNLRVQNRRAETSAHAITGEGIGEVGTTDATGATGTGGTSDVTETGKASRAAGRS
ncbi:MAG TPA: BON domain-containing protein [Pyrinomonadaceae bacterium]|nr:BON domain-containing protein [Pyrinomonadaceae bacterium]